MEATVLNSSFGSEVSRADSPAGRFPWWGAAGAIVFLFGLWILLDDVPVWNAVWYLPAWYGYLLVVDASLDRLGGRSLVRDRGRTLAIMMFWSIPFWFWFEAYNLRLANWSYVFVLRSPAAEGAVSVLAFATVLPACLLHAELVGALAGPSRSSGIAPKIPRGARTAALALGVACAVCPILWPGLAFWMVWFVPFFLAEPLLAATGSPSLLRDAEEGRYERLARLLAGGLWAGVVWELFNFWARSKWLYTVSGFERPKLFEMPLAGYLGFPALAISAFSFFSMIRGFVAAGSMRRAVSAAAAAIVLSGIVLHFVLERTVISRRPLLSELSGMDAASIRRLVESGLPTPERLDRAIAKNGISAVAASARIEPPRLARISAEAALALHKGMGVPAAKLLERAGVPDVAALSRSEPSRLFRRILAAAQPGDRIPTPALVRLWIADARPDGRPAR